jgi:probable H4MPT-linked C1 transfer pathway protein
MKDLQDPGACVVGLDIGGANLKAWAFPGSAVTCPFALWKDPAGLRNQLDVLVARHFPNAVSFAVTMTGELCDCFETKRLGVLAILRAVRGMAGRRPVLVFGTDGVFASLAETKRAPLRAAAANWLALATYAGRLAPRGPALLIDIGSTTTDIVPLMDGKPAPVGRSDTDRLRSGELVYKGVRRTPVCALTAGEGAAEVFATTLDIYLVLGSIREDHQYRHTADGRPATRRRAFDRLARMNCADRETCQEGELCQLAKVVHQRLVIQIARGIDCVAGRLPGQPQTVILSGEGEFLARAALAPQNAFRAVEIISLEKRIGKRASAVACAYAAAQLALEVGR